MDSKQHWFQTDAQTGKHGFIRLLRLKPGVQKRTKAKKARLTSTSAVTNESDISLELTSFILQIQISSEKTNLQNS